jgi:hypothetical protein
LILRLILRPSSTAIRHFSRAKSYREDEKTPLIGSGGQLLGSRHGGMPSNASAGQAWRHPGGLLYGDERESLCSRRLEPPKGQRQLSPLGSARAMVRENDRRTRLECAKKRRNHIPAALAMM